MKLRLLGYAVVFSALLGGCSSSTNEAPKNETPQQVVSNETSKQDTPSVQPSESKETSSSDTRLSKNEVAAKMETVLKQNFTNSNVYYNEEYGWFQADIIYDGAAMMAVFASADSELKTAWDGVVDSMATLNRSMTEVVESADYSDSVVLMLLNDENTDNVLVTIMDGIVMSNAAEE